MYIRYDGETQDDITNHAVTLNCCGDIQAPLWSSWNPSGGDYIPKFTIEAASGNPDRRWAPTSQLQNGAWYRFEWWVEFTDVSAPEARIWPRISDASGTLLHDSSTYRRLDNTDTQTLEQFYSAGGVHQFSSLDLARRFGFGYEGPALAVGTGNHFYVGAVEIRDNDWPGPI